eukprot:TRINITY_DN9050_c0_g1_i1.p1 TRINITY_DN9050_c0_g1~~TRINITY_DN9050_c0_g1_i1.p1  ORF type:complete len:132 (+),score=26.10 TRINITY_DN9050_c0_g1_i1:43-396(+)
MTFAQLMQLPKEEQLSLASALDSLASLGFSAVHDVDALLAAAHCRLEVPGVVDGPTAADLLSKMQRINCSLSILADVTGAPPAAGSVSSGDGKDVARCIEQLASNTQLLSALADSKQ